MPNTSTKILKDKDLGVEMTAKEPYIPTFPKGKDRQPEDDYGKLCVVVQHGYPRDPGRIVKNSMPVRFEIDVSKSGETANHARDALVVIIAKALGVEVTDKRLSALFNGELETEEEQARRKEANAKKFGARR